MICISRRWIKINPKRLRIKMYSFLKAFLVLKKYVLHYKNLKQDLDLGLELTKIHRRISFDEKAWLKAYIDLNTNPRSKAQNEFEIDFFKLINNSVFGKTMENIRNRVNIRLVNNQKSLITAVYFMKILLRST